MSAATKEISNSEDVIDSRDINERINWLEDTDDDDEKAERAALIALRDEAEGYAEDWQYGVALIRDSHFKDYAEELAEEIGAINRNPTWPNNCIDWDEAARQLQQDYASVEFDGVEYWVR